MDGSYWSHDGYELKMKGTFRVTAEGEAVVGVMNVWSEDGAADAMWRISIRQPPRATHCWVPYEVHSSLFGLSYGLIRVLPDQLQWRYRLQGGLKATDIYTRIRDDLYHMAGAVDGPRGRIATYKWTLVRELAPATNPA